MKKPEIKNLVAMSLKKLHMAKMSMFSKITFSPIFDPFCLETADNLPSSFSSDPDTKRYL
jgi:hypothetical protein